MTGYAHADECTIAAPARACFDLVLAVRRYAEWWRLVRCEALGPEAILRVGSRFRFSGGPVGWVIEVTGLTSYRQIDLSYAEGDMLGPVRWEFHPDGQGTRVRYVYVDVHPNSDYTRESFASGRGLRVHSEAMQSDAFAGMRRLLEGGHDVTGGDLFEALRTQRATRHFRPDPVPDAILREVLDAATRAPSARNAQPWFFVAVRDAGLRQEIAQVNLAAWRGAQAHVAKSDADADIKDRPGYAKMMKSVDDLAVRLGEIPVLVLACLDTRQLGPLVDQTGALRSPLAAYASIFPAVQNLMLAARGLGLGTTLTTLVTGVEDAVRKIVEIPPHVHIAALIPIGYPKRPFRVTTRKPLDQVVFGDRFGRPL